MKITIKYLVIFALLFTSCSRHYVSSDPLQQALLEENWKQSLVLADKDYKTSESVEHKAIKGHVFLANNINNESMDMFLFLNNEKNNKAWLQWTESFKNKYPKSPIALYLYGDALIRNGDNTQAVKIFETAEKFAEQKLTKSMIFNASGLAYLNNNNPDKAQGLFEQATQTDPGFGDAHTSLGMLLSSKKLYPGAVEEFSKALAISKDFNLATYGKACATIATCTDAGTLKIIISDLENIKHTQVKFFADDVVVEVLGIMVSGLNKHNTKGNEGTNIKYKSIVTRPDAERKFLLENASPQQKIELYKQARSALAETSKAMVNLAKRPDAHVEGELSIPAVGKLGGGVATNYSTAVDIVKDVRGKVTSDMNTLFKGINKEELFKNDKALGGLTTVGIDKHFIDFSNIKFRCLYGLSLI